MAGRRVPDPGTGSSRLLWRRTARIERMTGERPAVMVTTMTPEGARRPERPPGPTGSAAATRHRLPQWDERSMLAAARAGDEQAFTTLVRAHTPALRRAARLRVRDDALADEIVQETWLAVLKGLSRFEGRSSVRTWMLTILAHCADRRIAAERGSIPFTALDDDEGVDESRFHGPDHPRWAGMWSTTVDSWSDVPESRLTSRETLSAIREAISALPPGQREVIALRDVEGWSSAEVCAALGLSEGNQRVLLHRARSKVRAALERHLEGAQS